MFSYSSARWLAALPLLAAALLLRPAAPATSPGIAVPAPAPAGPARPLVAAAYARPAPLPADTSAAALAGVLAGLRREAYEPRPATARYARRPVRRAALNPAHGLAVALGATYYEVSAAAPARPDAPAAPAPAAWRVGWHLRGVGRVGTPALRPAPGADTLGGTARPGGRATFWPHPSLAVDYDNTLAGLRQSFRLARRPAGAGGPVRVALDLATGLHPVAEADTALTFADAHGRPVLRYGHLRAWDATGRALPMRLALAAADPTALALVVDDAGAQYPVTIDPLATAPGTYQALLSPNATVTDDFFGFSVAGAGDLNGDGYAEVVVGAYNASTTDNAGTNQQGRAYVYYGSASGLGTTAGTAAGQRQTLLNPNQTSTTDLFGYSVAGAGDLNGDGYGDLVVGAYGASTTDNTAATFLGRAYVYYGSASGLGPGTAGTAAGQRQTVNNPNTTVTNDLFGASVAGAGDLNGDGYADLVVGAYYASTADNAASTQQGRAYVFYGSAAGLGTTPGSSAGQRQTLSDPNTTVTDDFFGRSVAGAGDLNGDGYADLVVGAYRAGTTDDAASTGQGRAYVFYGSATGLSPTAGTAAGQRQTLNNPNTRATSDYFGFSVAGAGDLNGDGYADLVVGAYRASAVDNASANNRGRSYVYYGSASGLGTATGTSAGQRQLLLDPNTLTTLDFFGFSVAGAGDVNGDGYGDLVVGAYGASTTDNTTATSQGRAYVFYGSASGLGTAPGTSAGQRQTLNNPNPTVTGDYFGYSVAGAGDLNGDGYADLVVGAYFASTTDNASATGQGRAYVYVGSPATLRAAPNAALNNPNTTVTPDFFGASVAGAGDLNGDGYADLVVGAYQASTTDNAIATQQGRAYVYYGSATGPGTAPGAAAGQRQLLLDPNTLTTLDFFGYSVAGAGDLNGDGYADLVVGAYGTSATDNDAANNQGRSYVYYGSAAGLGTASGASASQRQTLYDPNTAVTGDRFGYSVAGAGDLNGDGYADLVVGAYRASTTDNAANTGNGRAYVYYGSASGLGTAPGSSASQRQTLLNPNTATTSDFFGASVAGAGDLNGDGYADLVVGAYRASTTTNAANTGQGRAYVYYGSASGLSPTAGTSAGQRQTLLDPNTTVTNDLFGYSVAGAGDLNGDGYADLVVGAYQASITDNATATAQGRAYVYYGSAAGLGTAPGSSTGQRQALLDPNTTVAADFFGFSVAGAGDLNGDGYADLVVGAYRASTTDNAVANNQGRAYVYYGSATGLSPTAGSSAGQRQALLDPNTTVADDFFGRSVAGAGDLNGDGYADLVVGAYGASTTDNTAATNQGRSYLFLGNLGDARPGGRLRLLNTDLATPLSAANLGAAQFGLGLSTRSVLGRVRARLVWEVAANGAGFRHASPVTNSVQYTGRGPWVDVPVGGTEFRQLVPKTRIASYVRARLEYATASPLPAGPTAPPQGTGGVGGAARYGPWQYVVAQQLATANATPLPVTLTQFTAAAEGPAAVRLAWATASEVNSARFEVQRSLTGETFATIGAVAAAGHSAAARRYALLDDRLPAGSTVLYYRLRQVDADGSASYSPVRAVARTDGQGGFTLYPNPAHAAVTVVGLPAGAAVEVFDALGRTVAQATADAGGTARLTLPAGLATGVYIVRSGSQARRLTVE